MARKSHLTDKQWAEIERRFLAGESARKLGTEFKIAESTIRSRFSAQSAQIKAVANQVIAAEQAFNSLNYSAQVSAQSLINELRAVSIHLAGAAKYGAMTAHRLSGMANMQLDKIDESELDDPDSDSIKVVKTVAGLTEVANKAAQTGINLLNANKDLISKANEANQGKSQVDDLFAALSGSVMGVTAVVGDDD
jgi:hypothetical protein